MTGRRLELHIGELVLDGLGPLDREEVGAAVQQELERLFAERGVPASLGGPSHVTQVDGGEFARPARPDATAVGAHVARSVYKGVSR